MEQGVFIKIWNKTFIPHAKNISQVLDLPFHHQSFQEKQTEVYEKYEQYKESFKELKSKPEQRNDRHKITASILLSIIEVKPMSMSLTIQKEMPPKHRLVNEIYAVNTALQVLVDFSKGVSKNQKAWEEKLNFPKTSDNTHYLIYLVKTIWRDQRNKKFSIELLSNLLFYIEAYHFLSYNYINLKRDY